MNEQISAAEGRLGRVVVIRLAPGADLLNGMQTACERYGIHNGVVISAIGSLACVRFCNVEALPDDNSVASELILIKVSTDGYDNNEILAVTSKYHASLVNLGEHTMTFRASGAPDEIDTLVSELKDFGIAEMARTGIAALENGDRCLNNT